MNKLGNLGCYAATGLIVLATISYLIYDSEFLYSLSRGNHEVLELESIAAAHRADEVRYTKLSEALADPDIQYACQLSAYAFISEERHAPFDAALKDEPAVAMGRETGDLFGFLDGDPKFLDFAHYWADGKEIVAGSQKPGGLGKSEPGYVCAHVEVGAVRSFVEAGVFHFSLVEVAPEAKK